MSKGKRNRTVRKAQPVRTLSKAEKTALNAEISQQVKQFDSDYSTGFAACVLLALNQEFGFGPIRLKRFWDKYNEFHRLLRKRYELEEIDMPFVCKQKLLEIGVDVDKWDKELEMTS